jgi:hypothetical protein
VVELTLAVPRLATSGTYGIEVDGDTGARARVAFEVIGQVFPPVSELAIDRLTIRGGGDGRAPRAGVIRRGERLAFEARIGGARGSITPVLRARRGIWSTQLVWPDASPARTGTAFDPSARFLVTGLWEVPMDLSPGRLQLELEVTEGEHVSVIHREVLVR